MLLGLLLVASLAPQIANADDQATVIQLALHRLSPTAVAPTPSVTAVAVVNNYALVSWSRGYTGGMGLLQKNGANWQVLTLAGGPIYQQTLVNYGVPSATAASLLANMAPPTPTPAPSSSPTDKSHASDIGNVTAVVQATKTLVTNGRVVAGAPFQVDHVSIINDLYALAEWSWGPAGGQKIFINKGSALNPVWTLIGGGGGQIDANGLQARYNVNPPYNVPLVANMFNCPAGNSQPIVPDMNPNGTACSQNNVGATPTPASVNDQIQLMSLANKLIYGVYAYPTQPIVLSMAISGNWALVNWTDRKHSGGEFIATSTNGTWSILRNGGGIYSAAELVTKGVPSSTASYLVANLKPPPPTPTPTPRPCLGPATPSPSPH